MAKQSPQRKQYRSMRGKNVDMDMLRKRNELTPAVGNARVNARGDELGAGGKIVKKREDVISEHYATAGTVRDSSSRNQIQEVVEEEPVVEQAPVKKTVTRSKKDPEPVVDSDVASLDEEFDDGWVEDKDGNFVPKGE